MSEPRPPERPYDSQIDLAAGALARSIVCGIGHRPVTLKFGALVCALLAPAQYFTARWF